MAQEQKNRNEASLVYPGQGAFAPIEYSEAPVEQRVAYGELLAQKGIPSPSKTHGLKFFDYPDLSALFDDIVGRSTEAATAKQCLGILELGILKFGNILQNGKARVENLTIDRDLPWDIDFHIKAQNEGETFLSRLREMKEELCLVEAASELARSEPPVLPKEQLAEADLPDWVSPPKAALYLGNWTEWQIRRQLYKPDQGRFPFFTKEPPEDGTETKEVMDSQRWLCRKEALIAFKHRK